jgi:hypothetical protein
MKRDLRVLAAAGVLSLALTAADAGAKTPPPLGLVISALVRPPAA